MYELTEQNPCLSLSQISSLPRDLCSLDEKISTQRYKTFKPHQYSDRLCFLLSLTPYCQYHKTISELAVNSDLL